MDIVIYMYMYMKLLYFFFFFFTQRGIVSAIYSKFHIKLCVISEGKL